MNDMNELTTFSESVKEIKIMLRKLETKTDYESLSLKETTKKVLHSLQKRKLKLDERQGRFNDKDTKEKNIKEMADIKYRIGIVVNNLRRILGEGELGIEVIPTKKEKGQIIDELTDEILVEFEFEGNEEFDKQVEYSSNNPTWIVVSVEKNEIFVEVL